MAIVLEPVSVPSAPASASRSSASLDTSQSERSAATDPRCLGRRPVLDGMRGVAILLVMLMHGAILPNGYIGVDVFFGLSGFLITSLLLEEWDATQAISFRHFYGRRAYRLLPGLFLLVGGFALLDVTVHPFTGWGLGTRALTTLTFINNWVAGLGGQGLGALNPTWSLAMEDQFYLLWPLALLFMLKRGTAPRRMIGCVVLVALALVAVVPSVEHLVPRYSLYYSPLDRFAELLAGCLVAVAWRYRLEPGRLAHPLVGWVLASALGGLLFVRGVPNVDVYLAAVLVSVLLLVNLIENEAGWLARLLACRPLRVTGRISYGLYLYNLIVHNLVLHWMGGHGTLFYAPIDFALTFLLAGLSWRCVESSVLARRSPGARRHTGHPAARRARLQPAG